MEKFLEHEQQTLEDNRSLKIILVFMTKPRV